MICVFDSLEKIIGKYLEILERSGGKKVRTLSFITGRNKVVAKVMFLQVSVILSTGGVSREPPGTMKNPPQDQGEPPRTKETPLDQADPPPPGPGRPPREEDCSIRSMSGRYASY